MSSKALSESSAGDGAKDGERRSSRLRPTPRSSNVIATEIRQAIISEGYVGGDQLPAEREIARRFGSSRSTVRNALRILEQEKRITRKLGSGTFVVHEGNRDDEDIAEITSPLELIEVRLALEPYIVRLAVMHGTARDISSLGELLHELEASERDQEQFSQADQKFHLAFAVATHNPLLVWMYQRVNDVRGHTLWNMMKDKILIPSRIAEYNASHRAIYEAVNRRDADVAAGLMAAHLEEARRDLLGAKSG